MRVPAVPAGRPTLAPGGLPGAPPCPPACGTVPHLPAPALAPPRCPPAARPVRSAQGMVGVEKERSTREAVLADAQVGGAGQRGTGTSCGPATAECVGSAALHALVDALAFPTRLPTPPTCALACRPSRPSHPRHPNPLLPPPGPAGGARRGRASPRTSHAPAHPLSNPAAPTHRSLAGPAGGARRGQGSILTRPPLHHPASCRPCWRCTVRAGWPLSPLPHPPTHLNTPPPRDNPGPAGGVRRGRGVGGGADARRGGAALHDLHRVRPGRCCCQSPARRSVGRAARLCMC